MKWRHVEEQKKKRQQEEDRRKRLPIQQTKDNSPVCQLVDIKTEIKEEKQPQEYGQGNEFVTNPVEDSEVRSDVIMESDVENTIL